MTRNRIVLGICFFISMAINLFVSLKYPDINIGFINFIVSFLFILFCLYLIFTSKNLFKPTFVYWITPIVGCILVFIFENSFLLKSEHVILDVISGIEYPLYILFVTPIFGLNWLLKLKVSSFSLVCSTIYFVLFILSLMRYKKLKSKQ